jgi:hypothetical protein
VRIGNASGWRNYGCAGKKCGAGNAEGNKMSFDL